ncbi:MAG: beta strand repeat-containing protein, partial [Ignavibacteria bacterium]
TGATTLSSTLGVTGATTLSNATIKMTNLGSSAASDELLSIDVASGTIRRGSASTILNDDVWLLDGNTLGGTKTLGSNDNQDIAFETNATTRLTIEKDGKITQNGANQVTFAGNVDANNGLDIQGADLTVNDGTSNVFTVDDATGNTSISGTLGVTGAATLSSTLGVTGAANLNGNVTLGDGGADVITVNSTSGLVINTGAAADMTITESALTRSGSIAINPGTGNNLTTNGGLTVAENATISGTLGVTGATTLSSTLGVTGATTLSSTLGVTGAASFDDNVTLGNASADAVTINAATVTAANLPTTGTTSDNIVLSNAGALRTATVASIINGSAWKLGGNTGITNTNNIIGITETNANSLRFYTNNTEQLSITSAGLATFAGNVDANNGVDIKGANLTVNNGTSNVFVVDVTNGNTTVSGTLGVTGATTLSSTLDVTGNVAVNTSKFTVTASNGNTGIAGTLTVDGAGDFNSTLTADGATNLNGNVTLGDGGADVVTVNSTSG